MPSSKFSKIKIVSLNKNNNAALKQVLFLLVLMLVAFTIFYAIKMFGLQSWISSPIEKFTEDVDTYKVILIYSDACGHCKAFKPTFDKVASMSYEKQVTFVKLSAESPEAQKYAKYASEGIPATIIEKNNVVLPTQTMVGNMTEEVFVARLNSYMIA